MTDNTKLKSKAPIFVLVGILGFIAFVALTLSDGDSQQITLPQAIKGDVFVINEGGFAIMHSLAAATTAEALQRNTVAKFISGSEFEVLDSVSKFGEIWKLGIAYDSAGKHYAEGWISSARIVNAVIVAKSKLRS
ncbi:MAG: hypothetical protein ACQ9MH_14285 [Nitrospinales bacterium]